MVSPTAKLNAHPDEKSTKTSDMFAMIGTAFLFVFYPSFNCAEAPHNEQQRAVINTVIASVGSACAAFIASYYFRAAKFSMVDIQNATLAGAVAIGTTANMALAPGGALAVGLTAGLVSVIGFTKVGPMLERSLSLHDTSGTHNLHGLPGIIGGMAGAIAAGAATESMYSSKTSLAVTFPARFSGANNTMEDRTAASQAGYQALYLAVTILVAIASGLITGSIANCTPAPKELFSDNDSFCQEEYEDLEVPAWYKLTVSKTD
jgi:ammonium transporter Rh